LLDGWEFYEYRLAENYATALSAVDGRAGFNIDNLKFRASCEEQRVDLVFESPIVEGDDDRAVANAAFLATEVLLGEECLNHWIGAIETTPKAARGLWSRLRGSGTQPRFLGLQRMKETVDALIGSMREQLPSRPHYEWVDGAEWSIWKLEPEAAEDYHAQQDLFVARSANAPQWTAAHGGGLFSSKRFSRCGEVFCYIKIDGSQGLPDGGFSDKAEVEDALDAVLKPDKLGCYIGGGTGLRYSYVDLALAETNRAIPAIREQLQRGRVPTRSWIQFYDSDMTAEWIGVYDDSPPPPMVVA
jgi:hypothetical protein